MSRVRFEAIEVAVDCCCGCNVWIRGGCCDVCGVAIGGTTLVFSDPDESPAELSNSLLFTGWVGALAATPRDPLECAVAISDRELSSL